LRLDSKRTFLRTHPWINFSLNLRQADPKFWMMVGEARSKCEHIAGIPLQPQTAEQLYRVYLAKGVHATTSIEGNTLTEEQVRRQIDKSLTVPESQQYLQQEIQNMIDAYNEIQSDLLSDPRIEITPERIKRFNALTLRDLPVGEEVVPGEFRRYSVGVANYRAAPASDCDYLIGQLCDWLNGPEFRSEDPDYRFALTLARAILAHLYIAWIHPFGDGNGRTARLVEFQSLAQSGLVPLPAAQLLSSHYNKTRSAYYSELDRSSKDGDGPIRFLEYAVRGFVDGLRDQLAHIREQQLQVMWVNHIHERFRDEKTRASERQKHLLLDMPRTPDYVPRESILSSKRVLRAYSPLSEKTLDRDLSRLVRMKLLLKKGPAYKANRELILAFLPLKFPELE
jgi:Fic family protein